MLERFPTGWRTEKGDRPPASKAFGKIQGSRGREPVPIFLRGAQCKGKPLNLHDRFPDHQTCDLIDPWVHLGELIARSSLPMEGRLNF